MEQESYIFKKDYEMPEGKINRGANLRIFRGRFYLDGGMILPAYDKIFTQILENPTLKNEYLQQEALIFNKL